MEWACTDLDLSRLVYIRRLEFKLFIHRRRIASLVVVASHVEMRISYFIPGIIYKPLTYTHSANGVV